METARGTTGAPRGSPARRSTTDPDASLSAGSRTALTDRATWRALAGESRQALLAEIENAGRPLDATEAAALVGLHRNTARVQLDVLCSVGLLRRRPEDRTRPGRPRVLYELVTGDVGLPRRAADGQARESRSYRDLARALAAQLAELPGGTQEAVRAGRRMASMLDLEPLLGGPAPQRDVVGALRELFVELGFDPRPEPATSHIVLQRCPFDEVAREQRAVVCALHLGMLEAMVERVGAPVAVEGLDALVGDAPSVCVVRLGPPRGPNGHGAGHHGERSADA